jgi:hypothetical protein
MSIVNFTGRACAVLIVAGSMGTAVAEEALGVTRKRLLDAGAVVDAWQTPRSVQPTLFAG